MTENSRKISPTLTKNNFDAWEQATLNYLYAKGWENMYTTSFVNPRDAARDAAAAIADEEDEAQAISPVSARADDISEEDRRAAWGAITSSLSNRYLLETRKTKLGEVEELLRSLRGRFYRDSTVTKEALKKKLRDSHLENFNSLDAFLDDFDITVSRLEELGIDYDEDEQRSLIFKGLTPEYEPIVTHFNLQERPSSTAFVINKLRDYEAQHLSTQKKQRTNEHAYSTSSNRDNTNTVSRVPCRDHIKGKCRRGNRCRFLHIQRPNSPNSNNSQGQRPTCKHCNKQGHTEDKCWKKHPHLRPNNTNTNQQNRNNQVRFTTQNSYNILAEPEHNDTPQEPIMPEFSYVTEVKIPEEVYNTTENTSNNVWLLDGGSTCAITYDRDNCTNIRKSNAVITVGGGHKFISKEIGQHRFTVATTRGLRTFNVDNIRICPEFKRNILPEICFLKKNCTVVKKNNTAYIFQNSSESHNCQQTTLVCQAEQNEKNGLFYVTESSKHEFLATKTNKSDLKHHSNSDNVQHIKKTHPGSIKKPRT